MASSSELQRYLDFARQTAWEAGRLTLGWFQTGLKPDFKSDDSPVTVADREAEKLIRERIGDAFPDHAILGEEFGSDGREGASHRWIIDPIDGTKSFISGVPMYGVLIGLEIDGVAEVGAMYFPGTDELVSAATGLGCHWNGRLCQVSGQEDLSRAIIAHCNTAFFAEMGHGEAWQRLSSSVYYNAGWCDAYGYLLVATGRCDLMIDAAINIWDCAPILPILREAGGYFGDWEGNEAIDVERCLATNRRLLPGVIQTLKG